MRTRHVLIGSVVALVTVASLGTAGCTKANDAAAAGLEARALPEPAREVLVPAGTALVIALEGPVSSATSRVDEPVRGTLAEAVVIDGVTAIPAGAAVEGVVTKAVPSGEVKGRGELILRFTALRTPGGVRTIAVPYARSARPGTERDATAAGPNVTLPAGTKLHLTLDRDIKIKSS